MKNAVVVVCVMVLMLCGLSSAMARDTSGTGGALSMINSLSTKAIKAAKDTQCERARSLADKAATLCVAANATDEDWTEPVARAQAAVNSCITSLPYWAKAFTYYGAVSGYARKGMCDKAREKYAQAEGFVNKRPIVGTEPGVVNQKQQADVALGLCAQKK